MEGLRRLRLVRRTDPGVTATVIEQELGVSDYDRALSAQRDYPRAFFDRHLLGRDGGLLHGPSVLPVLMGFVVFVIQGSSDEPKTVSWLAIRVTLAAAVVCAGLCQAFGYRLPPLPAGRVDQDVQKQGVQRYLAAMMVRFAFADLPCWWR